GLRRGTGFRTGLPGLDGPLLVRIGDGERRLAFWASHFLAAGQGLCRAQHRLAFGTSKLGNRHGMIRLNLVRVSVRRRGSEFRAAALVAVSYSYLEDGAGFGSIVADCSAFRQTLITAVCPKTWTRSVRSDRQPISRTASRSNGKSLTRSTALPRDFNTRSKSFTILA